jgi:APA family basic amino acid/polyamine antiporter
VPLVPIAGILVCAGLLVGIPQRTWAVYLIWLALGLSIYVAYGRRSSIRLRTAAAAAAAL